MFLSDNRCAFTTIHSLDKMTSTWIHIVSWIPFYWCVSSGIVCCREEKLQSSGQKSIRYLTSETGKSATFAIFLLDSVFLNSTMEFLVLVSVKRGDTKTIVGKQLFYWIPIYFIIFVKSFRLNFITKNWFQTLHVFIPSFIFRKSTKKGWMHIWNFLNELPEGRNMLKPWSVYNLIHETQWYFG